MCVDRCLDHVGMCGYLYILVHLMKACVHPCMCVPDLPHPCLGGIKVFLDVAVLKHVRLT